MAWESFNSGNLLYQQASDPPNRSNDGGPIELLSYGVAMKKDGLAVEGEGNLMGNRFLTDHIIQAINITIRRSDTPFICQDILSSITNMIYSI